MTKIITRRMKEKARTQIVKFCKKHGENEFKVSELNDAELYAYILADTYFNIDAMLGYDSDVNIILERAIENADRIKADGFDTYREANKDVVTRIM